MNKWYKNLTKLAMPIDYKFTGPGYGESYYLNLTGPEFEAFKQWLINDPKGRQLWDSTYGDKDIEPEEKEEVEQIKREIARARSINQLQDGPLSERIDEALSKFMKANRNRFHYK